MLRGALTGVYDLLFSIYGLASLLLSQHGSHQSVTVYTYNIIILCSWMLSDIISSCEFPIVHYSIT